MLLDYNAGRRREVDAINGAIPRQGKPLGVATPVNEMMVGIIKAPNAGCLSSKPPNKPDEKQNPPARAGGASGLLARIVTKLRRPSDFPRMSCRDFPQGHIR
jgi:hypothetical protein